MENPIESLPFANASPVVPAMPFPVCLKTYCKGFSTKASIHCSVWPHRVKESGRRAASQGLQCDDNLAWLPETLDRNALRNAGRRPYAMVVRQSEAPGSSEGVRTIVGSKAGQPGVRTASRLAYADGTQASSPDRGTSEMSPRASPPAPTTLRGRWLFLARVAWVAVAITALAIIVFSVPSSFEHYSSVCTVASEVCSERADGGSAYTRRRAGVTGRRAVGAHLCALNVPWTRSFSWCGLWWARSSSGGVWTSGWRYWSRLFLVTFGPVTVDTTDADALGLLPSGLVVARLGVGLVGNVCPCCSSCSSPADGSCRAGRAGSLLRSSPKILPRVLFPDLYSQSLALERISFWCSWEVVSRSGPWSIVTAESPLRSNVARPGGSSSARPWPSREPSPSRCRWTSPWLVETHLSFYSSSEWASALSFCSSRCRSL